MNILVFFMPILFNTYFKTVQVIKEQTNENIKHPVQAKIYSIKLEEFTVKLLNFK